MQPITIVAFYFIVWWLTFFAVLPFGVKTQEEDHDVTLGTEPSAPSKPMLLRKVAATTVIAALILAIVYYVIVVWGLTWDDIPFIPKLEVVV